MSKNEVKRVVGKRQALAIRDVEPALKPLLLEIRAGQVDGGGRQIDAGDLGAAFREPGQVDSGPAADFENRSATIAVKSHEPEQVMELLEMVLIEIVEKAAGA